MKKYMWLLIVTGEGTIKVATFLSNVQGSPFTRHHCMIIHHPSRVCSTMPLSGFRSLRSITGHQFTTFSLYPDPIKHQWKLQKSSPVALLYWDFERGVFYSDPPLWCCLIWKWVLWFLLCVRSYRPSTCKCFEFYSSSTHSSIVLV